MNNLFTIDATRGAVPVTVVTTAETVLATSNLLSLPFPTAKCLIQGIVKITLSANVTAVTVRVRRGTTTSGTLVGTAQAQTGGVTASALTCIPFMALDENLTQGAVQYVVTVECTGASANGSATEAIINSCLMAG
jgi:hypothetical protein